MFSWGNITEKLRIASFDCSNEVVVDLFAGFVFNQAFSQVFLVLNQFSNKKLKALVTLHWYI
jgi:hypothetical protein